jgi:hypothetical protein
MKITIRLARGLNVGNFEVIRPELEIQSEEFSPEKYDEVYAQTLEEINLAYEKLVMNELVAVSERRSGSTAVGQMQEQIVGKK